MESRTLLINMAEIIAIRADSGAHIYFKTTLGSCVGIILSHRKKSIFGLAHVMLPEMRSSDNIVGKYADSAIPELVNRMRRMGSGDGQMEAYLVGGACMFFASNYITDIGQKNIEATKIKLAQLQIPVVYEDVGGTMGRTVIFDTLTQEVSVKTLQNTLKKRA